MNDRLKFRVWDLDKKEYNQVGFLCSTMNENGIIEINCLKTNEGGYYYKNFVIEQSTGLKDKNGKLVFENDVVDIDSSTVNIFDSRAIVVWEDGSFILQWIPKGAGATSLRKIKNLFKHDVGDIRWWECEVIGNIHQDSHLLGGK